MLQLNWTLFFCWLVQFVFLALLRWSLGSAPIYISHMLYPPQSKCSIILMYWKSCQIILCFAYCKLSKLFVQWGKSRIFTWHFCKAPYFFLPTICALSCQWHFNVKCFIKKLQAVSPLHNPALFVLYNKLCCCDDRLLCCFLHQNRLNTASRAT